VSTVSASNVSVLLPDTRESAADREMEISRITKTLFATIRTFDEAVRLDLGGRRQIRPTGGSIVAFALPQLVSGSLRESVKFSRAAVTKRAEPGNEPL
jgi:hypothetical protein